MFWSIVSKATLRSNMTSVEAKLLSEVVSNFIQSSFSGFGVPIEAIILQMGHELFKDYFLKSFIN